MQTQLSIGIVLHSNRKTAGKINRNLEKYDCRLLDIDFKEKLNQINCNYDMGYSINVHEGVGGF